MRGGAGKTILSSGIIAALAKSGKTVAPFKKGPDYIDAGWLGLAADRPCYNLDSYLIPAEPILHSFLLRATDCDLAVIEGNRGLYDGIDLHGSTSTAELAKLLQAPVLLCVDCTKTTRTMAAVIAGCLQFDPAVMIRGVILNRVAGARHERILRRSIEHYCGLRVMGAVPKLPSQNFPERHMGLVPTVEHDWARQSIDAMIEVAERYLDLDAMFGVGQAAPGLKRPSGVACASAHIDPQPVAESVRVGVARDSAFQFYYPENIEALSRAGAEIVLLSPLSDAALPGIDALYIGGGFSGNACGEAGPKHGFQPGVEDARGSWPADLCGMRRIDVFGSRADIGRSPLSHGRCLAAGIRVLRQTSGSRVHGSDRHR